MKCWRTTWSAALTNLGGGMTMLAIGDSTGIGFHLDLTRRELSWLFLAGWLLRSLGTQLHGAAGADQLEVKKQLGLKADGTPDEPPDPGDPLTRNQRNL
jgi:hypothetical protein